jgi:chromosome condensin MukBEF complex kleisin-like MukF subunit
MFLKRSNESLWLDTALYPDIEMPVSVNDLQDQIDFIARLCAAWDFGILPDQETLKEIRSKNWRLAVDKCRLLTSPAYHLLRQWHDLPSLSFLGQRLAYICDDPSLDYV